MLIAIAFW